MKHSLPECMMPDGAEPCRGYTDLRKEWLSDRDAAHQAGEIHNNVIAAKDKCIEELEEENRKLKDDKHMLSQCVEGQRGGVMNNSLPSMNCYCPQHDIGVTHHSDQCALRWMPKRIEELEHTCARLQQEIVQRQAERDKQDKRIEELEVENARIFQDRRELDTCLDLTLRQLIRIIAKEGTS